MTADGAKMRLYSLSILFVAPLAGCSNSPQPICSSVSAVPIAGQKISDLLSGGQVPASWGGVLDLLEKPQSPDTSPRYRCTVHLDRVPSEDNPSSDPNRIAIWTAEHCLKWLNAQSAELNVFDPDLKKYFRFEVKLDEMERFKKGRDLFNKLMPDNLDQYLAAAVRPVTGMIERGTPVCKADTETLSQQYPDSQIVCSSVLDLARLEGSLSPTASTQPEIVAMMSRMNQQLTASEEIEFAKLKTLESVIGTTAVNGMLFWYTHWRKKVSLITKWRGYEGLANIIEDVRLCAADNFNGLCNQEFRNFFEESLSEYSQLATSGQSYPAFLQYEVNRPTTNTSHNLQWLLLSQKNVKDSMLAYWGLASIATNFLRKPSDHLASNATSTLGTNGPLFYGNVSLDNLEKVPSGNFIDRMHFFDKSILFRYSKSSDSGFLFLNQPGDSGTVFLTGHIPIGVVSTVNGNETSGGAAVTPLPEYIEDPVVDTNPSAAQKPQPINCK
jgi:hypothetical protein